MQELLKRAEKVATLDKKRTQGEWKAYPWKDVQGNADYEDWYINNIIDGMAIDNILTTFTENDASFIAAAPRMAALIAEMAEKLKDMEIEYLRRRSAEEFIAIAIEGKVRRENAELKKELAKYQWQDVKDHPGDESTYLVFSPTYGFNTDCYSSNNTQISGYPQFAARDVKYFMEIPDLPEETE